MKTILTPRITEKSYTLANTEGSDKPHYTFTASVSVTKDMAKKLIEKEYKVNVLSVAVVKTPAKARRFKGHTGYLPAFKKFIVELKKGQTIDAFQIEQQS